MALKAKLTGRCMDVYKRQYKAKDGTDKEILVMDLYIGRQIYQVSRIPDMLYTPDELCVDVPVQIYQNQYGLSILYDDTDRI